MIVNVSVPYQCAHIQSLDLPVVGGIFVFDNQTTSDSLMMVHLFLVDGPGGLLGGNALFHVIFFGSCT